MSIIAGEDNYQHLVLDQIIFILMAEVNRMVDGAYIVLYFTNTPYHQCLFFYVIQLQLSLSGK